MHVVGKVSWKDRAYLPTTRKPSCIFCGTKRISLSFLITEVASAAPNTPLLYYHFADKTGVNFSCVKLIEKAKEVIPTFAGVKFTGWDMGMAIEARRKFG